MNTTLKLSVSVFAAQVAVFAYMAAVGVVAPLTVGAQVIGVPFRIYSVASLAAVALAVGAVIWFSRRLWRQIEERDYVNLAILCAIGVAAVALTLWTNRPDGDEMYYIPNARYFAQNPDAPMDFVIHFLYPDGPAVVSRSTQTSLAYDYLRVVVAEATHIDFLIVYYTLSSAVAAFLIPVATYFLISRFTESPRAALVGVAITIGVLLVLIDAHQTFGNNAFPRIYQGKIVQIALTIPAFAAFGISYLIGKQNLVYYWMGIFMTSLAGLAMSATAIPEFPALAVGLAAGAILVNPAENLSRAGAKNVTPRIAGFALSLAYLVGYALYLRSTQTFEFGIGSRMAYGFPTDYLGTVMTFVNPDNPRTPIVVVMVTVFGFWLIRGDTRRFLAGWAGAITIGFLNPIVAPFLVDKIATPNAFYRMFYTYPFPLMGGLLAAELYQRFGNRLSAATRFAAVCAVFGLCIASYVADEAAAGYLEWQPVKYTPESSLAEAEAIIAAAPPGVVLTPLPDPLNLYGTIPVVNANYPTMFVRGDVFWVWVPDEHDRGLRENAALFAGGLLKYRGEFEQLLVFYPIRIVVLAKPVYAFPSVPAILEAHQLTRSAPAGKYIVVWKP